MYVSDLKYSCKKFRYER